MQKDKYTVVQTNMCMYVYNVCVHIIFYYTIFRIVDGVQECCHCNDSRVCFTSVTCVSSLLDSLEKISRGQAISDVQLENIQKVCVEAEKSKFFVIIVLISATKIIYKYLFKSKNLKQPEECMVVLLTSRAIKGPPASTQNSK